MKTISPSSTEAQISEAARRFLASVPGPYVAGRFLDFEAANAIPVRDPSNEDVVAHIANASPTVVDEAVRAAKAARDGPWARITPSAREKLLLDLADAIESDLDLLSELESIESGKSMAMSKELAVGACVPWIRYMAGWATKIEGSTLSNSITEPPGSHYHAMTVKEPVGVVGAIVPWNFALMITIWKLAPALACGCTIVLKPAEETSLGALRLAQLIDQLDFPAGVINIITGTGETTGAALARHPQVDKVTFTGSTEVGKLIGHIAVERMARVTLELGGKSPMILLDDFEEGSESLAAGLGMFFNQGQVCTSASRLLIHRSIYERTLRNLADVAERMPLGSGRDATAVINPVISSKHRDRISGFIDRAAASGAQFVCGRRSVPERGYYVAPTILRDLRSDAEVMEEEVFGPVVAAMPFDDLDEAIHLANNSRYGLAASVWTRDLGKAFIAAKALKAGTVWINAHNIVDPALPFGGYKESGIGREHGRAVLDSYLETKTITIRYA